MMHLMEQPERAASLFEGWEETMIWSCLSGMMGRIYANADVSAAVAVLGDFAFFGGSADAETAAFLPAECLRSGMMLIPQNDAWDRALAAAWNGRAKRRMRYAIRKEPEVFDREQLARLARVPDGFMLSRIDRRLYAQCLAEGWTKDLAGCFADADDFAAHGLGVVLLREGRIASGASSYSAFPGGIEIEIDTRRDLRRQGLAAVCGANLILDCLARGLYPSWDAQNLTSVHLAQRLGYHFDREYPIYELTAEAE